MCASICVHIYIYINVYIYIYIYIRYVYNIDRGKYYIQIVQWFTVESKDPSTEVSIQSLVYYKDLCRISFWGLLHLDENPPKCCKVEEKS